MTITDNEQTLVSLERVNDGLEAGPTSAVFRVRQTAATAEPTVVALVVTGTAESGADFQAFSGPATIAAGQTSTTINVSILDDALLEGDESIIVTLQQITSGSSQLAIDASADQVTLNIEDNDTATVSLAGGSVVEGQTGQLTLTQSAASPETTVITYEVAGTASSGTDFQQLGGSVTIPAGATTASIDVSTLQDALVESDETIQITLISASGSSQVSLNPTASSATLTLTDDDAAQVSLVAVRDAEESGSVVGEFQVRLSTASDSDTTVRYIVTGSATAGTDYIALSGSVTLAAGETTATIMVAAIDDALSEGSENIALTLSQVDGDEDITLNAELSQAAIEIIDDETPSVRVEAVQDAGEPQGVGRFRISQTLMSPNPTVIRYQMGGVAIAGTDYVALGGQATIPAGETSVLLDVAAIDDDRAEGAESVTITLIEIVSDDNTLEIDAQGDFAELDILDNETGLLRLTASTLTLEEDTTDAFFTITQDGVTDSDTVVSLQVFGSATAGEDYQTLPTEATIVAGQTSVMIPLVMIDDTLVEMQESIELTLAGIVSGSIVLAIDDTADEVTTVINDNDSATVSLGAISDTIEGGAAGAFEIVLSQPSSTDTVVTYTLNGSADSSDYSPLSGEATIPAGANSTSVVLQPVDDSVVESSEFVSIVLSGIVSPNPNITLDATSSSGQLVIEDNDSALVAVVSDNGGRESGQPVRFIVSLDRAELQRHDDHLRVDGHGDAWR